jgi:hypothetical protein
MDVIFVFSTLDYPIIDVLMNFKKKFFLGPHIFRILQKKATVLDCQRKTEKMHFANLGKS